MKIRRNVKNQKIKIKPLKRKIKTKLLKKVDEATKKVVYDYGDVLLRLSRE